MLAQLSEERDTEQKAAERAEEGERDEDPALIGPKAPNTLLISSSAKTSLSIPNP